jgi:hypothetical protein
MLFWREEAVVLEATIVLTFLGDRRGLFLNWTPGMSFPAMIWSSWKDDLRMEVVIGMNDDCLVGSNQFENDSFLGPMLVGY